MSDLKQRLFAFQTVEGDSRCRLLQDGSLTPPVSPTPSLVLATQASLSVKRYWATDLNKVRSAKISTPRTLVQDSVRMLL